MATQLGAVSFVSAPTFLVLKDGGGLKWLAYEFGVPLALILVMIVILPTFHRAGGISNYEYLEARFDEGTRTFTLFWGIVCVGCTLLFAATPEATRQTTIVLINAIGRVLYGPILAAFLLGMLIN